MRRILKIAVLVLALLISLGYVMYARNTAPVVPPVPADALKSGKPYVVKLHAQWCVVCMTTKDEWAEIEKNYATRVNLVVFDFTTDANTAASRAEAERLGLENFFEEYSGATGSIVVLDGRTKQVAARILGSRDFSEYRTAIDAALAAAAR